MIKINYKISMFKGKSNVFVALLYLFFIEYLSVRPHLGREILILNLFKLSIQSFSNIFLIFYNIIYCFNYSILFIKIFLISYFIFNFAFLTKIIKYLNKFRHILFKYTYLNILNFFDILYYLFSFVLQVQYQLLHTILNNFTFVNLKIALANENARETTHKVPKCGDEFGCTPILIITFFLCIFIFIYLRKSSLNI